MSTTRPERVVADFRTLRPIASQPATAHCGHSATTARVRRALTTGGANMVSCDRHFARPNALSRPHRRISLGVLKGRSVLYRPCFRREVCVCPSEGPGERPRASAVHADAFAGSVFKGGLQSYRNGRHTVRCPVKQSHRKCRCINI
jgi:hypothetical protein